MTLLAIAIAAASAAMSKPAMAFSSACVAAKRSASSCLRRASVASALSTAALPLGARCTPALFAAAMAAASAGMSVPAAAVSMAFCALSRISRSWRTSFRAFMARAPACSLMTTLAIRSVRLVLRPSSTPSAMKIRSLPSLCCLAVTCMLAQIAAVFSRGERVSPRGICATSPKYEANSA